MDTQRVGGWHEAILLYSVGGFGTSALGWGQGTCYQDLFWGNLEWAIGSFLQVQPNLYLNLCLVSSLFPTASAKNMAAKPRRVAYVLSRSKSKEKIFQMLAPEEGRSKTNSLSLSWAAFTHTKEGEGSKRQRIWGVTRGAVSFYYQFLEVARWCGSPSWVTQGSTKPPQLRGIQMTSLPLWIPL